MEKRKTLETKESFQNLELKTFDRNYFNSLEGKDGWIALDYPEVCTNPQYFTVVNKAATKLGNVIKITIK